MTDEEFGPNILVLNKTQYIDLKAWDLYSKWKEEWRRKHPILYFIEKVLDRIKNPRYRCKICGISYKDWEGADWCYKDCTRESGRDNYET